MSAREATAVSFGDESGSGALAAEAVGTALGGCLPAEGTCGRRGPAGGWVAESGRPEFRA